MSFVATSPVPHFKSAVLPNIISERLLLKLMTSVGIRQAGERAVNCCRERLRVGLSRCWPAWPACLLSGWWTGWTWAGSVPVPPASSPVVSDTAAVKGDEAEVKGCPGRTRHLRWLCIFLSVPSHRSHNCKTHFWSKSAPKKNSNNFAFNYSLISKNSIQVKITHLYKS